jgi:ribosomal protein S18 acetylase RimI-like enzyme
VALDEAVIRDVRRIVESEGPGGLRVDDLTGDDLATLDWSGSALHLASVGRALDRVPSGEVEYLVARAPSGQSVAKAGIDYASTPGAGTIMQLATADEVQRLGIATHLIEVAEERMRARGLAAAELGVEDDNPGARALYERLGYREVGRRPAAWASQDADGNTTLYETELAILRKTL